MCVTCQRVKNFFIVVIIITFDLSEIFFSFAIYRNETFQFQIVDVVMPFCNISVKSFRICSTLVKFFIGAFALGEQIG